MLAQSYEMLVVFAILRPSSSPIKGLVVGGGIGHFAGVIFKILLGFGGSFLINFVKVGK